MNVLTQAIYVVEVVLELLLVLLLLRGPFRKYLPFTIYVVAGLVVDVLEASAYYRFGWRSAEYRRLYWTDHMTLDLLLFLVVVAFTYEALRGNPFRAKAGKILAVIVLVGLVIPLTMLNSYRSKAYGMFSSQWFNHASQVFSFAAAVMNLVLWGALLSNRKRDPQLVTLTIGLGIVTASAAIMFGVRQFVAESNRWPLDNFMYLAYVGALLLWCSAFRRKPSRVANAAPPNALANPS